MYEELVGSSFLFLLLLAQCLNDVHTFTTIGRGQHVSRLSVLYVCINY